MFVYLSKKISIPNNIQLHSISWSRNEGFIAAGGEEGLLKVLRLDSTSGKDGVKGLAAPTNLQVNQNLDGHSGIIKVIAWNDLYQKLTTSDSTGLIIVWMMYKGSWYEEMINNRNKSVVTDMAWSADGTKICIVYEDGVVIVGSVDGNRLWSKEINDTLTAVEWSPDCRWLLFGVGNNEIHLYDTEGNYVSKVPIYCLPPGSNDANLLCLSWHSSIQHGVDKSLVAPNDDEEQQLNRDSNQNNKNDEDIMTMPRSQVDTPSLAICYDTGCLQLMKHENDTEPVVIQFEKLKVVSAAWNHEGTLIAVAGQQIDMAEGDQNVVHFLTNQGDKVRTMKVPGKQLAGCSWEAGGIRVCLAVDSHIFFANIRPDYHWGYCSETVVYSVPPRVDRAESCVVFWDTKLEEVYVKHLMHVIGIASYGDYCTIVNRADDPTGQFLLQLCNGIGTPVDFKYIDLYPSYLAMNSSHVVVASKEAFFLWQYSVPLQYTGNTLSMLMPKNKHAMNADHKDVIHHVDEIAPDVISRNDSSRTGRESGLVQKYSLPSGALQNKYSLNNRPEQIALNSNSTRLAVINNQGILHMFELSNQMAIPQPHFERKDVWNMQWDTDNDQLLAVMEKTRMFVLRGNDAEEPIVNSGYICRFKDLAVRTVLLDELIKNPESPDKSLIVDIEIKSLRDAKQLLEKMNIKEASSFIEQNPHPKLWSVKKVHPNQSQVFWKATQRKIAKKDDIQQQLI